MSLIYITVIRYVHTNLSNMYNTLSTWNHGFDVLIIIQKKKPHFLINVHRPDLKQKPTIM